MVPAESLVIIGLSFLSASSFRKVASAAGERQMLPQHTNTICIVLQGMPRNENEQEVAEQAELIMAAALERSGNRCEEEDDK